MLAVYRKEVSLIPAVDGIAWTVKAGESLGMGGSLPEATCRAIVLAEYGEYVIFRE